MARTKLHGNTHVVMDLSSLSRQRWKQLCLYAIGLCTKCGRRLRNHTQHCEPCAKRHGKYRLKQYWRDKLKDHPDTPLPEHLQ